MAMELGWVDARLPMVKSVCVEALDAPYESKQAGLDGIRTKIEEYYQRTHPDIAQRMAPEIKRAVSEVQKIYARNYFPEMNVSWKRFPDNIGHLFYPGCFRCHDGKHVSDDGKALSRDCGTCHVILAQKFERQQQRLSLTGVEYHHPVDVGDAWKEMNCSDCHGPR